MNLLKSLLVALLLFTANSALAQEDTDSLFRNIAQENYGMQSGRTTYGLKGVGSTCEIWLKGLPGSFHALSYLENVPGYGSATPGVRYYFLDAVATEGKLNWTSWDNQPVELGYDPVTYKVKYFNNEMVGCQL